MSPLFSPRDFSCSHRSFLFSSQKRVFFTGLLLCLVLLSGVLAPLAALAPSSVYAAGKGNPNPPITPPGWLKPQRHITPPLPYTYVKPDSHYRYSSPPHSWPVTMTPASLSLTPNALHFLSNDGRLGVDVLAGTIDAAALQQAGGSITLKITQLLPGSGGTYSDHIIFSTYQMQLLAADGSALTQLVLLHPITFSYHLLSSQDALVWQGQQVYAFLRGGDASTLLPGTPPTVPANQEPSTTTRLLVATSDHSGLTWSVNSDLTIPAQTPQEQPAPSHGRVSQQDDSPSPFAVAPNTITFGTQTPQALWGTPQDSQVDLNSGGLTYNYPLDLPPGPGGLVPPLALNYASGSVDESHNLQATAPWVGQGWNLSLGSITWSQENVTPGGTNHLENVWQFNDPSGISGQLIPPNLSASTIQPYSPPLGTNPLWFTTPTNHAKVEEVDGGGWPCWRAYFPNGIMEEFGCNNADGSVQSFKVNGVWEQYRWDLDLIVDRYGNQIHFNYQRITNPNWIQDAVLSDIEYDDPNCHQQTACSSWHPQVKLIFDASTVVQHLLNSNCNGWNSTQFRCDNPVDVGGIPVPEVMNSFVLNDLKVQVQGNLLREYHFYYTQTGPQTITDPYSGQAESMAGYLNLNRIQINGVNDTPLNAPTVNLTYAVNHLHYFDLWYYATPTTNCSPDSWAPRDGNSACYLWSRTVYSWYLTNIDNGRGWNETISWTEGHNNTHGVDSGAIDDPANCNAGRNSTNRCGKADDKNWSHYMVTQRQTVSNGETSTWTYHYGLVKGLASNYVGAICDECNQGFTWGNQNDNDQADYYNGLFTSYAFAQVIQPDGSYQDHYYNTTTGWGIAYSNITCYIQSCQVAPYFMNYNGSTATALAGHELHELDYGSDGSMLRQLYWTSEPDCQPTGFPKSGGGPPIILAITT